MDALATPVVFCLHCKDGKSNAGIELREVKVLLNYEDMESRSEMEDGMGQAMIMYRGYLSWGELGCR